MSMNKPGKVVEIDVSIQANTLIVGVNGGNVTAAPGDRVVWRAGAGVKTGCASRRAKAVVSIVRR